MCATSSWLVIIALCALQNSVQPPADAVLGSGSGSHSSSNLCQVVPGALPYAHRQHTSTSTQVRRDYEAASVAVRMRHSFLLNTVMNYKMHLNWIKQKRDVVIPEGL